MSAWDNLLAASSLALGTAWDLITHPITGGSGVIVNNGATAVLAGGFSVSISDVTRTVSIADNSMAVVLSPAIMAALSPGIVAQITTQPIGATA